MITSPGIAPPETVTAFSAETAASETSTEPAAKASSETSWTASESSAESGLGFVLFLVLDGASEQEPENSVSAPAAELCHEQQEENEQDKEDHERGDAVFVELVGGFVDVELYSFRLCAHLRQRVRKGEDSFAVVVFAEGRKKRLLLDFRESFFAIDILDAGGHDNVFPALLLRNENHDPVAVLFAEFPLVGGILGVQVALFEQVYVPDVVHKYAGKFDTRLLEELDGKIVEKACLGCVKQVVVVVNLAFGRLLRVSLGICRCFCRYSESKAQA